MPPPETITVKWNKQTYPNIPLPSTSDELKTKMMELTGVPCDRQSLLQRTTWKGLLPNGVDLFSLSWPESSSTKEEVVVTMMGTAPRDAVVAPPNKMEKTVFVEDGSGGGMNEHVIVTGEGGRFLNGLQNLGNTCYLNSVIQVLRQVDEVVKAVALKPLENNMEGSRSLLLQAGLGRSGGAGGVSQGTGDSSLLSEMKVLWNQLAASRGAAVQPISFVTTVRLVFPRFSEQNPRGGFVQQDADEFYQELTSSLSRSTASPTTNVAARNPWNNNVIDTYLGIEMSIASKCVESDAEPIQMSKDTMRRIQCTITDKISHLEAGIKLGLEGEVEKMSETLGRNAIYHQTKRLSRLPKYLTVQLNRFYWKRTPDSMDHQGINCKIMRAVKFPQFMDVYDMCDESVQQVLKIQRDRKVAEMYSEKNTSSSTTEASKNEQVGGVDDELARALAMSMAPSTLDLGAFDAIGPGIPSTFAGKYELVGVVTHKGRSSSSGHYMSWIKVAPQRWICFDDDHPSECGWEEIEKLAGGGDYHTAYLLLYRAFAE